MLQPMHCLSFDKQNANSKGVRKEYNMRATTALLPVLALLRLGLAAECSGHSGSNTCATPTGVRNVVNDFCASFAISQAGQQNFQDPSNKFTFSLGTTAAISNVITCENAANDIIDQCIGHADGGTFSVQAFTLSISFCG
jgi:hypothetical protein